MKGLTRWGPDPGIYGGMDEDSYGNYYDRDEVDKRIEELEGKLATLRGIIRDEVVKQKAANWNRCFDCDYESKCSKEYGCEVASRHLDKTPLFKSAAEEPA